MNIFVSSHFLDEVLKREQAASTAFGQIAIPHSMKMDCEKTGLAIAISPGRHPMGSTARAYRFIDRDQ